MRRYRTRGKRRRRPPAGLCCSTAKTWTISNRSATRIGNRGRRCRRRQGNRLLVTKNSYTDFQIKVEFWADDEANSGIFIRCAEPEKITADNSYEVNIFDKRPDPSYGTGGIVNIAKIDPMPKAAGKWNTFEITAKGTQLTVVMNGTKTVDVQDSKHKSGPFALQRAPGAARKEGTIKFRKVEIKPL